MGKYEMNGNVVENAFKVELLNEKSEMNEYYVLNEKGKEKITLSDLIGCQIEELKNSEETNNAGGDYSQVATSGYGSKVATSGDGSQVATSGYYSQVATSGDGSQVATSGYYSQVATSGDYSKVATGGYGSQVATSGYYSQVATSGYYSQVATSGYYSQVATSGDYSQVATSGYYSQVATSGDYSKVEINGRDSVGFSCGYKSKIKAINGTWISLCEYKKNEEDETVPIFALSGQIGNSDYLDSNNKVLSENETYMLHNKKFTPIIEDDGMLLIKISTKIMNDIEVIKCKKFNNEEELFCVRKNDLSAHGGTLKEAMYDLLFKEIKNMDKQEIVEEILKTGFVTKMQYRSITGACQFGTESFAKEHGYKNVDKVELNELLSKLDDKYYGAKEFKGLFRQQGGN